MENRIFVNEEKTSIFIKSRNLDVYYEIPWTLTATCCGDSVKSITVHDGKNVKCSNHYISICDNSDNKIELNSLLSESCNDDSDKMLFDARLDPLVRFTTQWVKSMGSYDTFLKHVSPHTLDLINYINEIRYRELTDELDKKWHELTESVERLMRNYKCDVDHINKQIIKFEKLS